MQVEQERMKKSVHIFITLIVVLGLLMGIYFLMGGRFIEKFTGGDNTKVVYYYLPGCGWCQKFMPEWDKFEKMAKDNGIEAKKVNAQENADEVSKKGITAFPTVHIIKGGKETEYTGDRTADALLTAAKAA